MFLSNEHLSRSVNRSPEVAQAVLEDLSTFVKNTHLQVRFVATTAVDQAVDAAIGDLEGILLNLKLHTHIHVCMYMRLLGTVHILQRMFA